jgi:hypothetical protein
MVGRPRCGYPLRGAAVRARDRVGHRGRDIEFSGRIKSLDPETRSGVVIVAAKSDGKKIFGWRR